MPNTITLRARLQAGGAKKLKLVAYTGDVMQVEGWDLVAVDLGTLQIPDTLTILRDHDGSIGAVVGAAKARVEGGNLVADVVLADVAAAGEVLALLAAGVKLECSIGVRDGERRVVRAGEVVSANGRKLTADENWTLLLDGELYEISILPHGADRNTEVALAARRGRTGTMMTYQEWLAARGFADAELDDKQTATLTAAYERETRQTTRSTALDVRARLDRLDALTATAGEFKARYVDQGETIDDLLASAIGDASMTPRDFENLLLRETSMGTRVNTRQPGRSGSGASAASDPAVLSAALALQFTPRGVVAKSYGDAIATQAEALKFSTVADVSAACLQANGQRPHGGARAVVEAALDLKASGYSSVQMPYILRDSAHKSLLGTFGATEQTWRGWAAVRPVKNFKTNNAVRSYDKSTTLDAVSDGGELKNAALSEERYAHSASTFGKLLQVTRTDLVNDDLGAFYEAAADLGRQAARKVPDLLYTLILANAGSFFSAGNSNYYSTSASILGMASLITAITALRTRVDGAGRSINLPLGPLVVPPALEWTAKQFINSTMTNRTGDNAAMGNPLEGIAAVHVEPRLSNTTTHSTATATRWFIFGSPDVCPTAIVSFLNGVEVPVLESVQLPANLLGAGWRCVFDCGADLADVRGAIRNEGA